MPILGNVLGNRVDRGMAARDAALQVRDTYEIRSPHAMPDPADGRDRMCSAAGCISQRTARWMAPWKNRRRPIFEQEWGCSGRCLTALVQAAVDREVGDNLHAVTDEPHRHRIPLGLVLLAQGWITHPQLQTALQAQRATGHGRIGDWLAQGCGLEEERIARGLGVQWNCPVLSTDGFSPSRMALVMPKRLIVDFGLVPLRPAGSSLLYVAFQDKTDAATALGVEQMSGLKVESGLLPGTQFDTAKASVLAAEAVPVQIKQVSDRDAMTAAIVRALGQRQPLAARLVRVHQYYWLRMWLETGAIGGTAGLPASPRDMEDCLFLVGQKNGR